MLRFVCLGCLVFVSMLIASATIFAANDDARENLSGGGKAFAEDVFDGWDDCIKKLEPTGYYPEEPFFAYRACMSDVERIASGKLDENVKPLPDALVIPPGRYEFQGRSFLCEKEGLYRFVQFGKEQQQRIVYHKNLDALLSAIAWIASHGNADNGLSPEAWSEQAKSRKLSITCGHVSAWAKHVLDLHGIRSRGVSSLTLETWNGYDNGHSLLEVYRDDFRKWVLYDLDCNCTFTLRGKPLSLVEFAYAVIGDRDYEIQLLANDTRLDLLFSTPGKENPDCVFLAERMIAELRRWYRRNVQAPLIGGRFFDKTNRKRIESYSKSYRYMDKDEFRRTFYGETSGAAKAEPKNPDSAQTWTPWPPELPLPAAKPAGGWIETARVAQPIGTTLWLLVSQHKKWAVNIRDEFGFNAVSLLVPETHNAVADPISPAYGYDKDRKFRIDDALFGRAMESFRAAGLRTVMYSSIMHCGHAWVWETGELGKQHPDWSQIDSKGAPVMAYGRPWLCPSSPAFDYCLDWTIKQVRRWDFDAVMLDNNMFCFSTNKLPSCYCDYCQAAFRRYVAERFGAARAKSLLGVDDIAAMRIPTDEKSELYRLWKHWRSRVWSDATERFRTAMRRVKPDIVIMANAQPLSGDWALASELQLENEDATLTETRGLDTKTMSKKMLLCKALGRGRPVMSNPSTWQGDWTQCLKATYVDGVLKDPTPLQSPETIRTQCALGLAHGVNPWIVFVGLTDATPSAKSLAEEMKLAKRRQEESAGAEPLADVVSIFSTRQRDYLAGGEKSLLSAHLEQLRVAQIPTEPLRDRRLPTFDLGPYKAVIAEGNACLSEEEVEALARWVRGGGMLLATPDVGTRDEIGRDRGESLLARSLGVKASQGETQPVAAGRVVWFAPGSDVAGTLNRCVKPLVRIEPQDPRWEVAVYRQPRPERFWVHLVSHDGPSAAPARLSLRLPVGVQVKDAAFLSAAEDKDASVSQKDGCANVTLPTGMSNAIIRLLIRK